MTEELSMFRDLIESADVPMYLKDKEGRILAVNHRVAEIWGTRVDAVIGQTDAHFVGKEEAKRLHELDRRVVETNEPLTARVTVTTPRGKITFLDHKFPVRHDGAPGGVGGVAIDVNKIEHQVD